MPKISETNTKNTNHSFLRSTGIVSLAVMVSRLLGLVREKVIAFYFPAAIGGDAFYMAFRIPNLLRELFAEGALSKAFISTFAETETREGKAAAFALANRIFMFVTPVLAIISAVGILATPLIVDLISPGQGFTKALDPATHFGFSDKRELTIFLARIMFPFLLLVSLAAITMGLLNAKKIFSVPAFASVFFNLGTIILGIAGYYFSPALQLHPTTGLAFGVLIGGALQFVVQIPSMYKIGFRFKLEKNLLDARVRQVLRIFAPAIMGTAVLQLSVFINSAFASEGEGWLTWLMRAFRLMHLPLGVFGVAISTVALPNLSRLVAEKKPREFSESLRHALQLAVFLTLPATLGLIILAEPISRLLFEGGESGFVDTMQTARALQFYALAIIGYATSKIVTDAFYAHQDTRTPMFISFAVVSLNVVLNYIFVYHLFHTHWSLAFSTGITQNLNVLILLFFLHRKDVEIGIGRLLVFGLKSVLSALVFAAAVAALSIFCLDLWGKAGLLAQLMVVFLPLIIGGVLYFSVSYLLRIDEARALTAGILRRIKRG